MSNGPGRQCIIFTPKFYQIDQTVVESTQDNTSTVLAVALREAEQKLLVSRQIEHTLKLQHQQAVQDIESKVHVHQHFYMQTTCKCITHDVCVVRDTFCTVV